VPVVIAVVSSEHAITNDSFAAFTQVWEARLTHSTATNQALTLVSVVSEACHISKLQTHKASAVESTTQARGSQVQLVRVQDVGVQRIGVTNVGEVALVKFQVQVQVYSASVEW
jgi:hypothetical protein